MPTRRSSILLPDVPPGDAGPWEVTVDGWIPTTLNEMIGRNKYVIHRRKKKDRGVIAAAFLLARVPRATGKRRVTMTIALGPRQRGSDPDAYFKGLLDSLTYVGALVDDSPRWVELAPVAYRRSERKATEIRLEDVE